MITFKHKGNFEKSSRFLAALRKIKMDNIIRKYAEQGVAALRAATPKDSGVTAESWKYEIVQKAGGFSIYWTNDNVTREGTPIVILLQYGHGTANGEFVEGRDFINPAIRPIFENIEINLWKEVNSL